MLALDVLLLAETGAIDDSEALQLRWEDVDRSVGEIHIKSAPGRRTKSGKSRTVPMTAGLHSAMRAHELGFRNGDVQRWAITVRLRSHPHLAILGRRPASA